MSAAQTPAERHSLEAERQILASILSSYGAELVDIRASGLESRDFYRLAHQRLYVLLCERADAGQSIEMAAVIEAIYLSGDVEDYGGLQYASGLADMGSPLIVADHIETVIALATCRRIAAMAPWLTSLASQPIHGRPTKQVEDAIDLVERAVGRLRHTRPDAGTSADDGARAVLDLLANPAAHAHGSTGIETLDAVAPGVLAPTKLIVLAARTGMGKSMGAVSLSLNAALDGHRVEYVTLEMDEVEQHQRYIAQLSGVGLGKVIGKIQATPAEMARIRSAAAEYSTLPLRVRGRGIYTLTEIKSHIRRQHAENATTAAPLRGVVVDYIGLMTPDRGERRTDAVTRWIVGFKELAKELGIWILVLAQVNRDAENRQDAIPRISNISDSTMIENTADLILLAHRPAYYDDTADPTLMNWVVGKNRAGPAGMILDLHWHGETGRVSDRPDAYRAQRAR